VGFTHASSQVLVFDVRSGQKIVEGPSHVGTLVAFASSPDGRRLLTRGGDGPVRLLEAVTLRLLGETPRHEQGCAAFAWAPGGRWFVAGWGDGRWRLWDGESAAPLQKAVMAQPSPVTAVAFDDGGRLLVAGSADGSVRLWDLATYKPLGPPVAQ